MGDKHENRPVLQISVESKASKVNPASRDQSQLLPQGSCNLEDVTNRQQKKLTEQKTH